MIGKRFGKLVVQKRSEKKGSGGELYWFCQCDCGNIIEVRGHNLKRKDGTRSGIKWTKDEVASVAGQYDVKSKVEAAGKKYDPLYFWFAMNYVYAVHNNTNRTLNGYVELAVDEITNKNICFHDVIKRIFKKI